MSNFPRQNRFQLRTLLGQTSKADVAIDDITIKPGACGQTVSTVQPSTTPEPASEKQWDCDFEKTCNGQSMGQGGQHHLGILVIKSKNDHVYFQ